eukprot:evm.model.NODE_1050_length_13595_cov_28.766165.2
MDATLEGFQARYEAASRDLRKDVDKQLAKASALHEDYMDKINQQQQRLAELTRSELRIRQQGFNTSLETFKRQYDDTWGRFSGTVRKLGPFTKTEVADQQRRLDEAFQQFMTQYSNSTAEGEADGWEFVTETNGVRVHRKSLPSMDGKLSKYCCVKATGILAASPADILTLFEDNTRVAEYNKFYAEGRDLEAINDCTKVVWAASPPMFFFKARDFCTVVHYRKLQDGTVVVVNRAVEHPDAPRTDNC